MSIRPELHILTEYSPFSMGFVIITPENRAVIIDGGRAEEVHNILRHVGEREVAAWILTHPHGDHIGAINKMLLDKDPIFDRTEKILCNFQTLEFHKACGLGDTECLALTRFNERIGELKEKIEQPVAGDVMDIDGLKFEFLFSKADKYTLNSMNDSSLVFRVYFGNKTVLFLGDLGPIAGDDLLAEYGERLKSDIVQMAHHGHMCVSKEVYAAVAPKTCIWCCASWLYNEPEKNIGPLPRMYGVATTRRWMKELDVHDHIVTKDGDRVLTF